MKMCMMIRSVNEFIHVGKKSAPIDIHQHLQKVYK